jgi:tetratricopeptide (TPR) repeat protein
VVATSRIALRLYGEHEYPVPPLSLVDAVALFEQRARAAGRPLRPDEVRAVEEICERLDRLPLAIELAAARSRQHAPAEILALLERRLEVAAEGPRDVEPRQHALRTAIRWSYDLLEPPAQDAFARAAVFAGSWTPAAAEAVANISLSELQTLASHNLVTHVDGRYGMLETIGEYAAELLERRDDAETLRRRHAQHVLAAAGAAEAAGAYDELELELPNLRAALAWAAASGERELLLDLAATPRLFWRIRGHLAEGRRWLADALEAAPAAAPPLRARALDAAAMLAFRQGDYDEAERLWEECLAARRELGDTVGVGRTLGELGSVAAVRGDLPRARALFAESVELLRAVGFPRLHVGIANLASVASDEGDYDAAVAGFEDALAAARAVGDAEGAAHALFNLGTVERVRRGPAAATGPLLESLRLSRELGYHENVGYVLGALADVDADARRAARLLGAAQSVLEKIGAGVQPAVAVRHELSRERLREALGEEQLEAALAEGRALDADAAAALALGE